MKKIYIIGNVGSGKTTLAKALSKKYGIQMYELDKIVWNDAAGNVRRSDEEIDKLFSEIINKESWIIEDVGRRIFQKAIFVADLVIYIKLNRIIIYKRCISRWIKQKIGKEKYNYKPTLHSLYQMMKWANKGFKDQKDKIEFIKQNAKKYKIIRRKGEENEV